MDIKKLFIWTSIIAGIAALIIIGLLVFNDKTPQCDEGHSFDNSTSMCYFTNSTCPEGMQSQQLQSSEDILYNCMYAPTKFLDNNVFKYILIILGSIWFVVFIIFLVNMLKKGEGPSELGQFKKEDKVDADRARFLWALSWSRETGIPIYGDYTYKKSAFEFLHNQRNFQKGQEWFLFFECEVKEGIRQGLFTIAVSLSRGEKWILAGNYNWQECHFTEYKFSRTMPLHTPQDPKERAIQALMETNPEKALELQKKMIEEQLSSGHASSGTQVAPDVLPQYPEGYIPPQPRRTYRRPWYGGYRR